MLCGSIYSVNKTIDSAGSTHILVLETSNQRNCLIALACSEISSEDPSCVRLLFDTTSAKPLFANIHQRVSISSDDLGACLGTVSPAQLREILRQSVLLDTKLYYTAVHAPVQAQEFVPGISRINYAGRVYDETEMQSLVDSALEFYLTAGRFDSAFCSAFSKFLCSGPNTAVKVVTVNSGSSANLLAMASLKSHKLGDRRLNDGDEVIAVAAGFPTSISPIVQMNLCPVFVDIEVGTYNINPQLIESAVSSRTKAIFLAHTLGIPFDIDQVLSIAEKYDLWVIEDNCDALGAEYSLQRTYRLKGGLEISGTRKTGTFGHIGTSSFYPAHHITMGEGGAVYTMDTTLHRILLSLRDWGRDCWCDPGTDATCSKRFSWKLGKLPEGYDHKYTYSHLGYNLKITDMQAAIGCAQLKKAERFVMARRDHWEHLRNGLKMLQEQFVLPSAPPQSLVSPFGFALSVRNHAGFTRDAITAHLEQNHIQTRTVFAGNMLRQPALVDTTVRLRIGSGDLLASTDLDEQHYALLPNTEFVMNNTFWIGVYPGLKPEMLDYIIRQIREFVADRQKD